jgi:lipid-A-disaccharide synthase
LGILPGSRQHEVERNLPVQLKAAALVHEKDPSVRFAVPVAKPSLRAQIEGCCAEVPQLEVMVLDGKASDVARVARAAITVSGTATLELLHYQCPMVIVYQLNAGQQWLANRLLTTEWVSLVNILAGREICPEYFSKGDFTADVARDALALLRPGKARKRCLTHMKNLLKVVDHKGVHRRAAETVVEVARAARAEQEGA